MSTSTTNYPREIAYITIFAALIIALAFVSIPGPAAIPIVLQNIACIMAGLILGPKRGTLAVALFLGLGLIGLPVLAGGRSVISAIAGPSVGYLAGYLLSAFVAGLIMWKAPRTKTGTIIAAIIATLVAVTVQYACGTAGLVARGTDLAAALKIQAAFVGIDLIKAVFVIAIVTAVHQALPDLRPAKKA